MSARRLRQLLPSILALVLCSISLGMPAPASASCNAIPPGFAATTPYRGERGALNRPFAEPGDLVKVKATDAPFAIDPAAQLVTIVFTPPEGRRSTLVIASDCPALVGSGALAVCQQRSDAFGALCVDAADVGLDVPRSCIGGANHDRRCLSDANCAGESCGPTGTTLTFAFPSVGVCDGTPAALCLHDDDCASHSCSTSSGRTLTGPATIAVSSASAPIPCALGSERCATVGEATTACIDVLFSDGTQHPIFGHFTALPRSNDYRALCTDGPQCQAPTDTDLLATVDDAGNLLIPMDWSRVLANVNGVPMMTFLGGALAVDGGLDHPIDLPATDALSTFSPEGARVAGFFEPSGEAGEGAVFFAATTDAPRSVLRIDRTKASGFDFGGALLRDVGPVVLRLAAKPKRGEVAAEGALGALSQVSLTADRLRSTTVSALAVTERIAGGDLNGDDDVLDEVLQVTSSASDEGSATAVPGSARALAHIDDPFFVHAPLVAVAGDVVAFIESTTAQEPHARFGDDRDAVLRVFAAPFTTTASPPQLDLANPILSQVVDPAPLIDRRTFALRAAKNDGDHTRLFFRVPESTAGGVAVVDASGTSVADAGRLALSADGRYVAFATNGQIVLRDLTGAAPDELVSAVSGMGNEALPGNGVSMRPVMSRDGRFVAFDSKASNFVVGDTNVCSVTSESASCDATPGCCSDVFVRDRQLHKTGRVSRAADGTQGNSFSIQPTISADGRFIAFDTEATNLIAAGGDVNADRDVYVVDRDPDQDGLFDDYSHGKVVVERVSINKNGQQEAEVPAGSGTMIVKKGNSTNASISADGRFVAFQSSNWGLASGELFNRADPSSPISRCVNPNFSGTGSPSTTPCASIGCCLDVFVKDRVTGLVELQTLNGAITPINPASPVATYLPSISADGRSIAFVGAWGGFSRDDTNGVEEVFVFDRFRRKFTRAGLDAVGREFLGVSGVAIDTVFPAKGAPSLSADGRSVVFAGDADATGHAEIYRSDLTTGVTTLISRPIGGTAATDSAYPVISADGQTVAFLSDSTSLVSGDANGGTSVFVQGPDPIATGGHHARELRVFDLATHAPVSLGNAEKVAIADSATVAGGFVAFLQPASATGLVDARDARLMVWRPGDATATDTGLTAVDVDVSETGWVAAIVPERTLPVGSRNGDADTDDFVVVLYDIPSGTTVPTHQAALSERLLEQFSSRSPGEVIRTLQPVSPRVRGSVAAFLTPEVAQGQDLNGDQGTMGDDPSIDFGLQLFDGATATLLNVGIAAQDFVIGDGIIAFRVPEPEQGGGSCPSTAPGTDLNGDLDCNDTILHVFDFGRPACWSNPNAPGCLISTKTDADPCSFTGCSEVEPYEVLANTVTFVGGESSDRKDLNGDGDQQDRVQVLVNVAQAVNLAVSGGDSHDAVQVLGTVAVGACSTSGDACSGTATLNDCADIDGGDSCIIPPGVCRVLTTTACDTTGCPAGQFCGFATSCQTEEQRRCSANPSLTCHCETGAGGICFAPATCGNGSQCICYPQLVCQRALPGGNDLPLTCLRDQDCEAVESGARCLEGEQRFQSLPSILYPRNGSKVFVTEGQCVQAVAGAVATCVPGTRYCAAVGTAVLPTGTVCDVDRVSCVRHLGACNTDGDCPQDATCKRRFGLATAADSDGDEVPDAYDNCPFDPNPDQAATAGVGNACKAVCGNAKVERGEDCDDGNLVGGDGCGADCRRCTPTPLAGCLRPTESGQSSLTIKDGFPNRKDALQWKWGKGAATVATDLGDPPHLASDAYSLCLYDSAGLRAHATVPGGPCDQVKPCWKALGTPAGAKGVQYKNKSATPDGIAQLLVKTGASGKAKILFKAKGASIAMPTLPLSSPLHVQLQGPAGTCWEAAFAASGISANSGAKLIGRGE